MLPITLRQQLVAGVVMLLLMTATRGQHVATLQALPDASWAIFFLAGLLLASPWWLAGLLGAGTVIDMLVWNTSSSGDFCITVAYGFLLPAYGSLWLGGRWLRGHIKGNLLDLWRMVFTALTSAFVCELFSSGGFYFLSGQFADPSLPVFAERLARYFPGSLQAFSFYLISAMVIYGLFAAVRSLHARYGTP